MKVLLVGVSTRSMAQSAIAAGNEVVSLDYFGDRDQPAAAKVFALGRDFDLPLTYANLANAVRQLVAGVDAGVFGSGVENEPALLDACQEIPVLGNTMEAMQGVRDLHRLGEILRATPLTLPETCFFGDPLPKKGRWLVKDLSRSGGSGVKEWDGTIALHRGQVLQRRLEGRLCSATFLADGKQTVLLGLTRQYAGVSELGASGFAWCGNVAPLLFPELETKLLEAANAMALSFGLRGLNGIDFIVNEGTPALLEVNPRYPGSVELLERVRGVNAFQLHVEACQGRLPQLQPISGWRQAWGKGILYARQALRAGDTSGWMERDIADVPHEGEEIPKGSPICTLLAPGNDLEDCWQNVLEKAGKLESLIFN
jgi:predicted ATP-grasp superfamily ATP-dependent carboligase